MKLKKTLLTTLNAKYIHKNLAIRWLYVSCPHPEDVMIKEFVIKDDPIKIAKQIMAMDVEVVGFSTYIWNIDLHLEIIQYIKKHKPSLKIIIGGPEVSYESYDLINQGVDAISIGEGEISMWQYVEMLSQPTPYEIKGIYTKAFPNQEYQWVDLKYLEQLPSPYFLKMDEDDMDKRYFYFETSRGCPYNCSYCLSSSDHCVRMFSLDYVMKVLEQIKHSKIKQVKLLDRTFNVDWKRAMKIATYMNDECINQSFQFEIVAETLSEELLHFFTNEADVSRFRFEIGVQSFNKQTLTSVGRIQNNERLKAVIQRLQNANCIMHVDLIAALPHEDLNSFQNSFNELFDMRPKELQLGILKLLKGTKLKAQQEMYGFEYHKHAPYDVIKTNWLSYEELALLNLCGDVVERFWNSGFARDTIQLILELGIVSDAFSLFMILAKQFSLLPRPYQPHELMLCFKKGLKDIDEKLMDALMLMSYYQKFKQKPHHFTNYYVDRDTRKQVIMLALVKQIANEDILFRYGLVDIAYHKQLGYQLVLYNALQQLPKRYFINEEISEIIML